MGKEATYKVWGGGANLGNWGGGAIQRSGGGGVGGGGRCPPFVCKKMHCYA